MNTNSEGGVVGSSRRYTQAQRVVLWAGASLFISLSAIASVVDELEIAPDLQIEEQIAAVEGQVDILRQSETARAVLVPTAGLPWKRATLPMVSNPVLVEDSIEVAQYDAEPERLDVEAISMVEDAIAIDLEPPSMAPLAASAPRPRGQAHWQCLAEAIYFEARSEDARAQRAVAEVILNRVDSRRYPNTICQVVNQGAHRKHKCQFSYNCDGVPERISEPRAWKLAQEIAREMVAAKTRPLTKGATHYHTTAVRPYWSSRLTRVGLYGNHIFYTQNRRVSRR